MPARIRRRVFSWPNPKPAFEVAAMPGERIRWTLREDRLLVRLRCEGIERDMIAEALGKEPNQVSCRSNRLRVLGILETISPRVRLWRLRDGGMERLGILHARTTPEQPSHDTVAELFQEGLGHRAIAEKIGVSPVKVRRVLAELRQEGEIGYERRPWTDEERTELAALFYGGTGDAHIAIKLGRSAHAVICQRKEMGLHRGEKGVPLWS
jgi:DNA-binding Lrp family transcriptional regulator